MKIFGVLLTAFGLLLFLSCLVTRRRLRMQDERVDTWLEEREKEMSKRLGVPRHMIKMDQRSVDLMFKIATVCIIGGLSMILLPSL